jgi:hypothetical protein
VDEGKTSYGGYLNFLFSLVSHLMKLYPLFVGSLGNIFGSSAPNAAQYMLKALCPALENENILGQQFWIW